MGDSSREANANGPNAVSNDVAHETLIRRSRTPWGALASLAVALLYGASPIDLIPDLLPLIGWADDVVVAAVFVLLALRLLLKRQTAKRQLQPVTWRSKE